MSKLILALTLILSLGFTTTSVADGQLSEHLHDIDYSGQSDANICSWFQVVPVPEDYINEAKKRGLTCGSIKYSSNNKSTKNINIPENAYVTNSSVDGWKCLNGFNKGGDICFPKNASKKNGVYQCNSNYTMQGNICIRKALPKNAYAASWTTEGFICNPGYTSNSKSCIKNIGIPDNASISFYDPGWKCNVHYYSYPSLKPTKCLPLPENSYSVANNKSFSCISGYEKYGDSCRREVSVPKNAFKSSNSQGWACVKGYYVFENGCLRFPSNSIADGMGGFNCKTGYRKSTSQHNCLKIPIPLNAYASSNSQGWKCNYQSYQDNGACLKLPNNASASNGGGYYCKSGYRKSTSQNACVLKVNVPANAYASGSGWKCNSGFKQSGNSCIEIPDDTIYRAGSGTGFATTYDGHILTNHHVIDGCSQVTVHNKGKSYITTLITQDPKNDLAILISDHKPSKIYTLSTEVYLSDDIYAAGFPFGKRISSSITVNRGIVSALMGPGDDISKFQIDADINSGNSGGPIVDKKGNAIGIAVSKLNREKALEELGSVPEGFNFAVNSMMAIGLFRSQGIDLPVKTNNELSVKDRNDLFNQGTFYLACGMTTAQYEKMAKTEKVMFTREVFFSDFKGN
ncbi:S1C family serine protease [Candidatus Thioglobus sp.]|nr:S1C family serine protease [Candidatus Thioglobus sp.]MDA8981391.1 S1C family serine protease [Candidatus Thioglobus sp.]